MTMTKSLLAIDVGGSTSRAYLVDTSGRCLGRGRTGGGNPASNRDQATDAIISSVAAAVAQAGSPLDIELALIALAGPRVHLAEPKLEAAFRSFGLRGPLVFSGDLLAMFTSVTPAPSGYCVVAGTGAGAVRIRGGAIERAVDAVGWLLGDSGSGYWLGHQGAKAVVADLEGRGERTALTGAFLEALGVPLTDTWADNGRPMMLKLFVDAVYAMRPIELAKLAPAVIANRQDPVAAGLIARATDYLASDFAVAFDPAMPGPVALGGGVIAHLSGLPDAIANVVRAAGHIPDIRPVVDGSIGAVVLAMRASGITVDEPMFAAVAASLAAQIAPAA
jgi:N-acetylglucosamine kinase-like BadF-type ATPase